MPVWDIGASIYLFQVPLFQAREKSNIASAKMRKHDLIVMKGNSDFMVQYRGKLIFIYYRLFLLLKAEANPN